MNKITIVTTLASLILIAPIASQARDYYIVATADTTLSSDHAPDTKSNGKNVIAVWSDENLCNRVTASNNISTVSKGEKKHKKSTIAPRMSRKTE